jgi:hypothetical protein
MAATAWDSLLLLARGFSLALKSENLTGMTVSVAQAFILALQFLGISYLLYALGRMLVTIPWKWSGMAGAAWRAGTLSEDALIP